MKRFYWLLALPYVVTVSTGRISINNKPVVMYDVSGGYFSFDNRGIAEDLAQALNDAHERRNAPSLIPVTDDKGNFAGWK